jgi:hypothetical protein
MSSILPLLQSTEAASLGAVSTFISANLLQIIISVVSFVIVTFIVGVGVMIFKYSMIMEALTGKRVSIKTAWKGNQDLLIPIILLRIIIFVICLILIGIIGIIALLIYFLIMQFSPAYAAYTAIIIGLLLATITLLFLKFIILFRYPVMFFKKLKYPVRVLKESFQLFKHDKWFVIYTWVVMAVLGLIFSLAIFLLGNIVDSGLALLQSTVLVMIISSVWLILDIILRLTGQIWAEIYLFTKYSKRQTP